MKIKLWVYFINCLTGMLLLFSGCTKDLYDSNYEGNKTNNPLGINAPTNFDWSTISTVKLNVEVKDEYSGKYDYIVEIYDGNPLYTDDARLLGAGIAKQGKVYSTEISYPQDLENIFVKQTDPRGRPVIRCFSTVTNNGILNCDFHDSNQATTRAVNIPNVPDYTSIPADAQEISGYTSNDDWLDGNTQTRNFKITGNYTGGIYHSGSKTGLKLYVSGTWNILAEANNYWHNQIENGLDIIVLSGGKIIVQSNNLSFANSSNLIVMEGGNVDFKKSTTFNNNGYIYNRGVINIGDGITMQSQSAIYNFCTIHIANDLYASAGNAAIYLQQGTITAYRMLFTNMHITLSEGSMLKAEESILNVSGNTYSGSGTRSLITSPLIAYGWAGASYIGPITIEANSLNKYNGSQVLDEISKTELKYYSNYKSTDVESGKCGSSGLVIETCTGIANPGNPGTDPKDPEFPIEIETNGDDYIYAMEDEWPSYGDYDMNDLVLKLTKSKIAIHANNSKTITYKARIIAMGANKAIAAAIQFDKITSGQIENVTYSNEKAIEGFTLNAQKTENGQDKAVIPFFANARDFAKQNSNYINVGTNGTTVEENMLPFQEISIRFGNSVKDEDINIRNINFFITNNGTGNGRTEIHLAGYEPTKLADVSLFGTDKDNSVSGQYKYLSKDSNLPWGLIIPTGNWKCPSETINILTSFPSFKEWATSGGKENKDWYKNM